MAIPINKSNFTSYLLRDGRMKETLYGGDDRYYSADEVDFFIENLMREVDSIGQNMLGEITNVPPSRKLKDIPGIKSIAMSSWDKVGVKGN